MFLKHCKITFHQAVKICTVDFLKLVQEVCYLMQLIHMLAQNLFTLIVSIIDNSTDFFIDMCCNCFGIVSGVTQVTSQEYFTLILSIHNWA